MAFEDLRRRLIARLDEGGRGDRAWWLLTRVHLSAARLRAVASYIHDVAGDGIFRLTPGHYRQLGLLLDVDGSNPAQTINRHYLLTMDNPLLLIERVERSRWTTVRLTATGRRLATDPDTAGVFEDVLQNVRFCRQPWYSEDRSAQYSEFDIQVYPAAISVLRQTDGIIDTDEFDLFLSRVRTDVDIDRAAHDIMEYRTFSSAQQRELLNLVAERVPGTPAHPKKKYQNWRDMGRHTFSLFTLGRSLNRVGNTLRLTTSLVTSSKHHRPLPEPPAAVAAAQAPFAHSKASQPKSGSPHLRTRQPQQRQEAILKLPEASHSAELEAPPVVSIRNSGGEAELLIGKMLAAAGWQVVYYTGRRGFGFDLWAKKGSQSFLIEVKSSVTTLSVITLTPMELAAARHHRENFLLIIVEGLGSDTQTIWVVQDPVNKISPTKISVEQYSLAASECRRLAISSVI